MIGIIQKVLFDAVRQEAGDGAVKQIYKAAKIPESRHFYINKPYSDKEFQYILAATIKTLGMKEEQLFDLFADYFFKYAIKMFPTWFDMAKNSRDFLILQPSIHNSFVSGLSNQKRTAEVNDKFKLIEETDKLILIYKSVNKLCSLYIALAKWVVRYYGDKATFVQISCMNHGDEYCEIHIRWQKN